MVIDERLFSVVGGGVDGACAVFDTCQSVLLRTHPQAAVGRGGHAGHLLTGQLSFIADDALVARAVTHRAVRHLRHRRDVAQQFGLELIDIVAIVGQTGLLGAHPQQVSVVHEDTLNADDVVLRLQRIGTIGLHRFHLVGVDTESHQSRAVSANPDVALAVACHAIDAAVGTDARHSQLVANGRVPRVGGLEINHQRALTIEPDIVFLVGKGLERLAVSQLVFGNIVGLPHGVLLVHDITTHDTSVGVYCQHAVLTLAERAYFALRNADDAFGKGKLIVLLLLHVISHQALAGHYRPEVLLLVDIHDGGTVAFDAHLAVYLLHVTLETLGLGMIDADARGRLNPQRSFHALLNADDIAVGQRRTVMGIALEIAEVIAVISVETAGRSQPHIASGVFHHTVNLTDCQSVARVQRLK